MALKNFYEKTTKSFEIKLKFNGEIPNLRGNHIFIIFKKNSSDLDKNAVLLKEADTETRGEEGIAIFDLTKEDTSIEPGTYFYEIKWSALESEYIIESGSLTILNRIFD